MKPILSKNWITNRFLFRLKFLVKSFLYVLLHPIAIVYFVILGYSWISFPDMNFNYVLNKSFSAVVDGITFSVVDSLVSFSMRIS